MKLEILRQFGVNETINCEQIGTSYFALKDAKLPSRNQVYNGKCLGHHKRSGTVPSIDFLQHIGKQSKHKITVNSKGEWLVICGRDVFGKSIVKHTNPAINDIAVILNEKNECLGYGKVIAPLEEKKVVVELLFDIGDLLRRERKSKPL